MIVFTVILESTPRAESAVIYLRLYVYQTHLVLGLNGADGLYTGPIQILFILSILYESTDKRFKSGYENRTIYCMDKTCVVEEKQYKRNTSQWDSLVILCICIKRLFSHKVVLHSLLLMALFGPCGVCDGEQRARYVIWFEGIVIYSQLINIQYVTFFVGKSM